MIKKLLFRSQNKTQLIVAMIGAFLGFTFLVTSIHYLIRVNEFGKVKDILGDNTVIVQKKITNFTTMNIARTDFSKQEIKKLREQPFLTKVQPIVNNSFGVSLQTDSKLVPYFRTDVFVQTVDKKFLVSVSDEWQWKEGDEYVPIILPHDFLVMINTFASAKGIPQISEDLAKSIGFKFTLYNDTKKEWEKAKIVGFTNKVSAILVPQSFMDYGNTKFPTSVPSKTTQVMLTVKEGKFGQFEEYMSSHLLTSNKSSMIIGRLKSIAGILFSVLIGISIITVFLAGLVLTQYAQLLISRNQYTIRTLLRQGYSPNYIIGVISRYFITVFAIISLGSLTVFAGAKLFVDELFLHGGIVIDKGFTTFSIAAVVLAFLIYTFVNYLNARKGVLGTLIAKKKD